MKDEGRAEAAQSQGSAHAARGLGEIPAGPDCAAGIGVSQKL